METQRGNGSSNNSTATTTTTTTTTWTRLKDILLDFHLNSDRVFYCIGLSIGKRPWLWLLVTFVMNCVCIPGMLLWKEAVDDVEMFVPDDSIVRADATWVRNHFHDEFRYESIIVTAPNVLEPEVLRSISKIEQIVKNVRVKNSTWKDVCAGYLTWFNKTDTTDIFKDLDITEDILAELNSTAFKDGCIYQSIVQLWDTGLSKDVRNLTKKEIVEDVNKALRHKIAGNLLLDISPLLSGLSYDKKGRIRGAKATILNWLLQKTNSNSEEWELEFIDRVLRGNVTLPAGVEVYAIATRSYIDTLHQILNSNLTVLCCGISLIVVYVTAMIGKCNALEQRIYLSLMGVFVVGQAILSSYGLCYYLRYSYGPLHSILPFLLLGIGVDNMFVIMQSLTNLPETDQALELPVRIAKAMQQSGMSVTVTSFTNVIAFAFGITTVMPCLRSFYAFATLGILFLYIYEVTFFMSCLVYDEKRLQARKDGCFCRPRLNWKPNECSQRNTQQILFENYIGPWVVKNSVRTIILLITGGLLCVNTWAIFQLEQNFDPLWYLNQDSYPIQFNNKLKEYFPKYGKRAGIYMTGVDYYEDRDSLFRLVEGLKANRFINNGTLEPWFIAYEKWLNATNKGEIESSEEYYNVLTEYLLLTKEGQAYIKDIKFSSIPAGEYNITTSQIPIQHVLINTTIEQVQAMESIRETVQGTNFSQGTDYIAIFSPDYVSWTANKVIGEELTRNLCLEIITIGVVIVIFLRDFKASFWVLCCVLFTLIDLLGSMYFLNLTIEMSSSIMILLCAGLAVDYAAHIGLEFIRTKGSKKERAIATLSIIGPAVFNGGLSTFLAFVLLGSSEAYIFSTFFKLFTCVVMFGLFHGLLFLPVILSLLGPGERRTEIKKANVSREHNGYCTVPLSQNEKDSGSRTAK
ncbi:PREDICTED: patched domain-containing protein 3-like [Dufourea novaeangliae]|uniref:Patched domain-containing protein 3 n=1 Tax=Dufourea novaeangliae TaxID=178035 RepID=A0A154PHI7_DUFNO|nr:PREDICTED: patched domain-containing protein 3-like [Dufourea novaeangliae]KZC10954.1 Patched domain-containing protein 3 [Dufourea novaeangliae]